MLPKYLLAIIKVCDFGLFRPLYRMQSGVYKQVAHRALQSVKIDEEPLKSFYTRVLQITFSVVPER